MQLPSDLDRALLPKRVDLDRVIHDIEDPNKEEARAFMNRYFPSLRKKDLSMAHCMRVEIILDTQIDILRLFGARHRLRQRPLLLDMPLGRLGESQDERWACEILGPETARLIVPDVRNAILRTMVKEYCAEDEPELPEKALEVGMTYFDLVELLTLRVRAQFFPRQSDRRKNK